MRETPYRGDGHDTQRILLAKAKRERKNLKRLVNKANGGYGRVV